MVTGAAQLEDRLSALLARDGRSPADGVAIVALDRLASQPFDPGMALVILPAAEPAAPGRAPAAIPGRHAHGSDGLALLRRLYPPDHPVIGEEGATRVEAV